MEIKKVDIEEGIYVVDAELKSNKAAETMQKAVKDKAVVDRLINGKGTDSPDEDFDYTELVVGAYVEHEHTSNNEAATRIAKTHLIERKDYYKNALFAEERKKALAKMAGEE